MFSLGRPPLLHAISSLREAKSVLERQGCSVSPMSSIVGPEGQAFDRLRVSNKGFAYILMKTELSFYLQTSIRPNKPLDPAAYTGWNNDRNFSLVIWDERSYRDHL